MFFKLKNLDRRIFWVLFFAIASILMTYLGWIIFYNTAYGNIENNFFLDLTMNIFMWPSLLLDSINIPTTNHSFGFLQNLVGWSLIGLIFGIIIEKIKNKKKISKCE